MHRKFKSPRKSLKSQNREIKNTRKYDVLQYSACHEIDKSSTLDKILCDGDALYQTIINTLKVNGKFIHSLLSLGEIPDVFEVEIGRFIVEKQSIVSGILVDTHEEHGLPTLHHVLNSTLTTVSSGLLTIGSICSSVFKKNGLYSFFWFSISWTKWTLIKGWYFHYDIFLMSGWSCYIPVCFLWQYENRYEFAVWFLASKCQKV